jgi:hypothetical protein
MKSQYAIIFLMILGMTFCADIKNLGCAYMINNDEIYDLKPLQKRKSINFQPFS